MQLPLTDDEADELRVLLDETLRDLSSEIAGTDNAAYRSRLRERRQRLREIREHLGG